MARPPDWLLRLSSADGLFVSDGRQRIVAWNEAAERLLGVPAAEVLGRACFDALTGDEPGGHPICRRDCRVATNARRGRGTPEYVIIARDRAGTPIQLTVTIVLAGADATGSPYLVHLVRPRARAGAAAQADPARLGATPDPDSIPPLGQPLSRREFEVLTLLATGRSTAEIADELTISRFTARNHIANAQRKLGAHSRVEAVVYAAHHRLI